MEGGGAVVVVLCSLIADCMKGPPSALRHVVG